jgi:hypothetical protein
MVYGTRGFFNRAICTKMIEVKKYLPKEVVPQADLIAWRANLKRPDIKNCPMEVIDFINAMAEKLDDFGRIGEHEEFMKGRDLLLCVKEFGGEKIEASNIYPIKVPHMVAVDHQAAMHRSFFKRGKQGLIDYCKARVNGTELERALEILNVHVFKQEREEFKKVMVAIKTGNKIQNHYDGVS